MFTVEPLNKGDARGQAFCRESGCSLEANCREVPLYVLLKCGVGWLWGGWLHVLDFH